MPRPDDFAILVGIQDYPGMPVGALSGPVADVEYFYEWLVDPDGGDVDPKNIRKLVSQNPRPNLPNEDFPPTREEFRKALRSIVIQNGQVNPRPNGRLYLYFSGHGFSDFKDNTEHAALYTGNAEPADPANVCGTKFAEWCRQRAAFGEVFLVMDCCRDVELSKQVLEVDFGGPLDPKLMKKVKVFEIYAVPYGGKAQERFFKDLGRHHGVLTYALVAALKHAPLEKVALLGNEPVRSGHALKDFIEGTWAHIAGDNGPELPRFRQVTTADIAFSKQPPRPISRVVHFAPPVAGAATLRLLSDHVEVIRVELDAVARTAVIHNGAAAPDVRNFDGTQLELSVRPEVFGLVLEQPGAAPRKGKLKSVGDEHVSV